MKLAPCLRVVFVIGKYTDIFQGGGIFLGKYFLWVEFPIGREVSGTRGELARIHMRFVLFVLLSRWRLHFKCGDALVELSWRNLQRNSNSLRDFYVGEFSIEEIFHGGIFTIINYPWGRNFPLGGVDDFWKNCSHMEEFHHDLKNGQK